MLDCLKRLSQLPSEQNHPAETPLPTGNVYSTCLGKGNVSVEFGGIAISKMQASTHTILFEENRVKDETLLPVVQKERPKEQTCRRTGHSVHAEHLFTKVSALLQL